MCAHHSKTRKNELVPISMRLFLEHLNFVVNVNVRRLFSGLGEQTLFTKQTCRTLCGPHWHSYRTSRATRNRTLGSILDFEPVAAAKLAALG